MAQTKEQKLTEQVKNQKEIIENLSQNVKSCEFGFNFAQEKIKDLTQQNNELMARQASCVDLSQPNAEQSLLNAMMRMDDIKRVRMIKHVFVSISEKQREGAEKARKAALKGACLLQELEECAKAVSENKVPQ